MEMSRRQITMVSLAHCDLGDHKRDLKMPCKPVCTFTRQTSERQLALHHDQAQLACSFLSLLHSACAKNLQHVHFKHSCSDSNTS